MADSVELVVGEELANKTLARVVRDALGGVPWSKARKLCETGRVRVDGERVTDSATRMAAGAAVAIDETAPRIRRGVLDRDRIVHLDSSVVVVDKPAGTLTVPYQAGDKDTLVDQTFAALRRLPTRPQKSPLAVVQRLDKDTTGLLVFARNLAAKRSLSQQLRDHSVTRRYLALVHGAAKGGRHETWLLPNRGDGLRGSEGVFRRPSKKRPNGAKRAVTHVEVVERLSGATLVACELETGRQHQIRIHLSEAGHPLLGEPVYIRDYQGERIRAPRPMLHAETLGFDHPDTGDRLSLRGDPPDDFRTLLAELRKAKR